MNRACLMVMLLMAGCAHATTNQTPEAVKGSEPKAAADADGWIFFMAGEDGERYYLLRGSGVNKGTERFFTWRGNAGVFQTDMDCERAQFRLRRTYGDWGQTVNVLPNTIGAIFFKVICGTDI